MKLLRLKDILKEKGISGKDFSEGLGITPVTLSRISGGKAFPSPDLLQLIAKKLDMDIKDLFYSTMSREVLYIKRGGKYISIGEINLEPKGEVD